MSKKSTRSHLEERRTHSYLIGTESGTFDSFDKALKAADALKNALVRKCKEMDYHCIAVIGVSRHTNEHGVMKPNKFGKREYEPYVPNFFPESEYERPPHLHILLIANPGVTLKNFIVDYFKKNHSPRRTKVTWEKKVDTYGDNAVRYVLDQSEKMRIIDLFSEELNPQATCFTYSLLTKYFLEGNKKRIFPNYDYGVITKNFFALTTELSTIDTPFNYKQFFDEAKQLSYLKSLTAKLRVKGLWSDYADERMS